MGRPHRLRLVARNNRPTLKKTVWSDSAARPFGHASISVLETAARPGSKWSGQRTMTVRTVFPRLAVHGRCQPSNDLQRPRPTFDELYEAHVDCLWRNARGLGLADDAVDDVLQQVFIVLYRRLPEVRMVGCWRTWLIGVLIRVVRDHKRHLRRKSPYRLTPPIDLEELTDDRVQLPEESVALGEAATLAQRWLDALPESLRIVF